MEGFNLKKFFSVFFLCMGLFCITAFAESVSFDSVAKKNNLPDVSSITNGGGISNKYWVLTYEEKSSRYYVYYSDKAFLSNSYDVISPSNRSVVYVASAKVGASKWSQLGESSSKNLIEDEKFINTSHNIGDGVNVFFSPVQMSISEMQEEALGEMMRDFGKNSVTILKSGLLILALLLGVSLVPRLIHLFL